jgi:NADH-quinone oxidoreductase subunit L
MNALALTILFPLLGAITLGFFPRMPEKRAATIGATTVGLSGLTTAWLVAIYPGAGTTYTQTLWTWINTGGVHANIAFYLDGLSLTMIGVVTGVGFLIHLFATWYIHHELEGEIGMGRFFAYMNLFIAAMLILVLGNNLLLLYLGWEGVGLCSYLLVGFYYKDEANAWCAFKAFLMTRIGDVALAIGLFLLFFHFHTLNIQTIMAHAPQAWATGSTWPNVAALLILGGAVGKSAQLPLQTWLIDAMAGPTPVSALIHAATMVTAGVYLIARTHVIFELAPAVLQLVAVIGTLTLLLSAFAALAQTDIKRVLAYSTMSQIGYMFLALGVGAWQASIFHLMIHAFFKALLFLTAGSVIIACHHEQNIFRMGGLVKKLKFEYWLFWIGGGALAALPLVTAGFWSKDQIIWLSFAHGHDVLWFGSLVGSFLTAVYIFRMIFIVFHGEQHTVPRRDFTIPHTLPLVVLGILSTFIGALIPQPLSQVLPIHPVEGEDMLEMFFEGISSVVAVTGLGVASVLFLGRREIITQVLDTLPAAQKLWQLWHYAWGFDWLYDRVFVQPYRMLGAAHRRDWINTLANGVPGGALLLNGRLAASQNGRLRSYALGLFAGATALLLILLFG